MSNTVSALAATSAIEPLSKTTIERRDVGPHDVSIDIKFAGICHTDIHTVRGDWGPANYPVVPGHEIAGVVAEVGSEVTKYKIGDRVGVGCHVDSCRECASCRSGLDQYCTGMVLTYNAVGRDGVPTHGGYSAAIVVDENYVLRIPDGMPLKAAAPLLCSGITMYSPLRHWNTGPGKRVAIVGLGGLGHIGVKLAAAMGADVTVLSQSLKKMDDGLRFGASHYYATSDPNTFVALAGTFDLIVNTVSADVDIAALLSLLAVDATLVEIGLPANPIQLPVFALAPMRRNVSSSLFGGIAETQEMLDFCAAHDIRPEIELIDAGHVNEAYERVLSSDVRYRFVIDMASL
jgi:alcohol dehydrogenase (NADP+)